MRSLETTGFGSKRSGLEQRLERLRNAAYSDLMAEYRVSWTCF
jgi:hypothetical protein